MIKCTIEFHKIGSGLNRLISFQSKTKNTYTAKAYSSEKKPEKHVISSLLTEPLSF